MSENNAKRPVKSTGYIMGSEMDIRGQQFLKLNLDRRAFNAIIRNWWWCSTIDDLHYWIENNPDQLLSAPMVGLVTFNRIKLAVEEYKREQVASHDQWEETYFAEHYG